ncbi:hypothetical protein MesoLjLa_43820 [Mesorhizobium sp. L-2-11]|nr:hypothetical protein MesoLjLa_43820 [Mesorhizobium sp. L-2-11]
MAPNVSVSVLVSGALTSLSGLSNSHRRIALHKWLQAEIAGSKDANRLKEREEAPLSPPKQRS